MSLDEIFSTTVVERPPATVGASWRPQLTTELQCCETACRNCVDALLEGSEPALRRAGVALAASCAEICAMTAALLTRSDPRVGRMSRSALDLCAEACTNCAEECARLPGPVPRRCADSCRSVLGTLGNLSPRTEHRQLPARRGPRWSVDPVPPRAVPDVPSATD